MVERDGVKKREESVERDGIGKREGFIRKRRIYYKTKIETDLKEREYLVETKN